MRLKVQLSLFILSLLIFDGCKKKQHTTQQNLKLVSADNVVVSGQTVTLTNNSSSQTNGFSLTFIHVGNLTCNNVSILTTAAFGFVPNNSTFVPSPVTSTMPQYTCVKTGSSITLSSAPPLTEGFHPWVDNFNIKMGTTTFTVSVNTPPPPFMQLLTRGTQASMNLDPSFQGCGLRGTVLQRVFDCSKKIVNYAVYVDATSSTSSSSVTNANGTSSYYTLFTGSNPELYWFVVSCPSGNGGAVPQQNCHWLTPLVPSGNPALDSTGAGTFPTFTLALLTGYQQRMLLSGKMIRDGNGYNFADANGFAQSAAQVYSSSGTMNPGVIPTTAEPVPSPASVCNAVPGGSLTSGTFSASDANIRDLLSSTTGATITWQMPSYAMENILTGGTTTGGFSGCPVTSGMAGRPLCNTPPGEIPPNFTNEGFSAINVPGFSQTEVPPTSCTAPTNSCLEVIWSSSSSGSSDAWLFLPLSSGQGGFVHGGSPTLVFVGVRCASLTWY